MQTGRGAGPDFAGRWVAEVEPEPLDTIEIVAVTEEKPDASGRRKVTVRVKFVLTSYPKGTLGLGFNLRSPVRFLLVEDKWIQAGIGEAELTATITPVAWPGARPFKAFVSLSVERRPNRESLLATDTQIMTVTAAPALAMVGSR